MRAKAIEIRWHNTQPIYSTDFQKTPPSNLESLLPIKCHPYSKSDEEKSAERSESENGFGKAWRLATAGGDNLVMMWLVYPKPTAAQLRNYRTVHRLPGSSLASDAAAKVPTKSPNANPPIVEYLATLAKHQGVVNVVRFCPKGEMLASAGDDGNVLLWVLSTNPTGTPRFGEPTSEKIYERESWRTRLMLRGPAQCEIYDLAWSPCGDFLLTGDTAKTARIWNVTDGLCIKQITEHMNFVQGVAWDPLGKYMATQSSDRSMNVYSVELHRDESGSAMADVHQTARNYKIDLFNPQINSWAVYQGSPQGDKQQSNNLPTTPLASDVSTCPVGPKSGATSAAAGSAGRPQESRSTSTITTISDQSMTQHSHSAGIPSRMISVPPAPTTPSGAQFHDESLMQPPSEIPHHSHYSVLQHTRCNNSRSRQSSVVSSQTMSPSLRSIRSPSPVPPLPAMHINEGPRTKSVLLYGDEGASAFFRRLSWSVDGSLLVTPAGRWENQLVMLPSKENIKGKAKENEIIEIDSDGTSKKSKRKSSAITQLRADSAEEARRLAESSSREDATPSVLVYGRGSIAAGTSKCPCPPIARLPGHKTSSVSIRFSPVIYELSSLVTKKVSPTVKLAKGAPMQDVNLKPVGSGAKSSVPENQDSFLPTGVFNFPYRMVYAVATHDSVFIYDTQQSTPLCMFSNMHFASFTDVAWTSDGEGLILSSSDGYCSLVSFDRNEIGTPLSEEGMKSVPRFTKEYSNVIGSQDGPVKPATCHSASTTPLPPVPDSGAPKPSDAPQWQVKSVRPAPESGNELAHVRKKRATLIYEGPVHR